LFFRHRPGFRVADPDADGRIRELKRRIAQDVTSPLFIGLAEEYRAAGRLSAAIRTLEKGTRTHPHYVSAKVALARAYLEAGQTGDASALFGRVLALDPGNLISAKALAEIAVSRGNRVEAIKKYKLYRALSGDRAVDEIIGRIESELAGPPPESAVAPRGRVLADLYLQQGHDVEALAIYDQLAAAAPEDAEVARLRSETAVRLRGKGQQAADDRGAVRREAKIRALKGWLRVIQTG
jgi:tetratricopeptide (TPR) repeat protein